MRSVLLYFCLTLLISLLLPVSTLQAGAVVERIRTNGTLVLGTPGDFPPFSVASEQGEIIGFDISFARELARSLKVNLRIKRLSFSELTPALLDGSVDIIMAGMSITAKRNMDIAFVGPYGNSGQAFVGKKEIVENLKEPLDLNQDNLRIAVLKDTTADMTLRTVLPRTQHVYTESLDQSLIMLLNGDIDGIISDFPYCKVAEFRYKDDGILVFDKILTFEQLGIGVSPDDFLMVNIVRNFINLMAGSGGLNTMQELWFKNSGWVKDLPDLKLLKDF